MHKEICEDLNDLYKAKNADYGDSFADTRRKYPNAILIRLNDKMSRLESLMGGASQQVSDESIDDTLKDLANYCLMELVERRIDDINLTVHKIAEKLVSTPEPVSIPEPAVKKDVPEDRKSKPKASRGGTPPHQAEKICSVCGKKFTGAPAAKKCPDCRKQTGKVTVIPSLSRPADKTPVTETISDCSHKDCRYRARNGAGMATCDYLLLTGVSRGCGFSECDKYQPKK